MICFTEVQFTKNLIPVEESTKNKSFLTLYLSPTVTKNSKCSFFFVNKRSKYSQGQP
jgi:dynactin complex subunit